MQQGAASARMVPEDFEVVSTLGEGAYSVVYVERWRQDGGLYAVKVLKAMADDDQDEQLQRVIQATKREMRILLMCSHPHIVSFHAAMQQGEERMYVMEFCKGGTLTSAMKRKKTIPLPAARHIAAEIASALSYLHTGEKKCFPIVPDGALRRQCVTHRDLKPDNIVFTAGRHIKLIDFGSASNPRFIDEVTAGGGPAATEEQERSQTFCGTMHFVSPELVRDGYTVAASDFWALGVILFEMLVGRRPFDGPPYPLMDAIVKEEPAYPSSLDPTAADLISKLLIKDHAARMGMEGLMQHPFFAGLDWSSLHTVDTAPLWIRNANWQKDESVAACQRCQGKFGLLKRRHHCRHCGGCFCADCAGKYSIVPDSTYTGAERVCIDCYALILEEKP